MKTWSYIGLRDKLPYTKENRLAQVEVLDSSRYQFEVNYNKLVYVWNPLSRRDERISESLTSWSLSNQSKSNDHLSHFQVTLNSERSLTILICSAPPCINKRLNQSDVGSYLVTSTSTLLKTRSLFTAEDIWNNSNQINEYDNNSVELWGSEEGLVRRGERNSEPRVNSRR